MPGPELAVVDLDEGSEKLRRAQPVSTDEITEVRE